MFRKSIIALAAAATLGLAALASGPAEARWGGHMGGHMHFGGFHHVGAFHMRAYPRFAFRHRIFVRRFAVRIKGYVRRGVKRLLPEFVLNRIRQARQKALLSQQRVHASP